MKNNTTNTDYELYHLYELEKVLKTIDQEQYPEETEEIKSLIAGGGYQYPKIENKRPIIITVLVIIGIISGLAAIPLVNSRYAHSVGAWYPYFLGISIFISFIYHVGLWFMNKWAAYLYIAFIISVQVISYKMGLWTPKTLIEPAIVAPILLVYFSRMH